MPEKRRLQIAAGLGCFAGGAAAMGVETSDGAWFAVCGLFVAAAALVYKFTKD